MSRIKRTRPSPAILIAVLALVAALAGTAFAGPGPGATDAAQHKLTSAQKKQVNKIAKKKDKKALKKAKQANQNAKSAQETAESATPLTAVVAVDGTVVRGNGVTSTNAKLGGSGLYTVEFDRTLSDCAWVAQIGNGDATATIYGEMSTFLAGSPNGIFVQTASSAGILADRPFQLVVHC